MTSIGSMRKVLLAAAAATSSLGAGSAFAIDDSSVSSTNAAARLQVLLTAKTSPSVPEVESPLVAARASRSHLWIFSAFAAGAFIGVSRLVGVRRIVKAAADVAPKISNAAGEVMRAPLRGVKSISGAVGRALAGPFRALLILSGLGLVAMTGVGFYNIEWLAGLAVGAAMVTTAWYGVVRTRQTSPAVAAQPLKQRSSSTHS